MLERALSDISIKMSFIRFWNFNGHGYGLNVQNLNWQDAKSNALTNGGYLVEINTADENIFLKEMLSQELTDLSNDNNFNYADTGLTFRYQDTKALDGISGNAAYVWTGGTDEEVEGDWIWSNSKIPISINRAEWGSGDLGNEPDNTNGDQDSLAFGLETWPSGLAQSAGYGDYGEWNDINKSNLLFSIIEFDAEVDEVTGPVSLATSNTITYEQGGVYRLYNSSSGKHLFSSNQTEIDQITGQGWVNEGMSYKTPSNASASLHRFFVLGENRHFYTANDSEKDLILANPSMQNFSYEGIAFNVYSAAEAPSGSLSVVRYFNNNTGSHLYSTNSTEQGILNSSADWTNEGIAWYGDTA